MLLVGRFKTWCAAISAICVFLAANLAVWDWRRFRWHILVLAWIAFITHMLEIFEVAPLEV